MERATLLFVLSILSCVCAMQMPGGITDTEKVATEDVKSYVLETSPAIKKKAAAAFLSSADGSGSEQSQELFANDTPIALSFKTQVVAGTNYFIKTKLGKFCFHVRVYRDLKGNLSVSKVTGPVKETDPIKYF